MTDYLEIEPARAKSVKPDKVPWERGDWLAHEKMNGWRWLLHFGGGLERPVMTNKRISSVTGRFSEKGLMCPQLWPSPDDHRTLGYTVIDCEVMPPPGRLFGDIAGVMNAGDPATAQARVAEIGVPRLHPFDLVFFDGEDWREKSQLERLIELTHVCSSIDHEHWFPLERLAPSRDEMARVLADGGEGLILKDISSAYGDSGAWIKAKRCHTLEVVVTDFEPGRGKYSGQIGAVCVSVYDAEGRLVEVGRASGMTDDVRRQMSDERGAWLGRVVEVEAQEWGVQRLLHPRWLREREDVDARACTWSKMMADLGRASREPDADEPTGQKGLF